jgi:probable 2-oxoglutarate dehydrogenase E1 component DHKTD1
LLNQVGAAGVQHIVLAMPHRGRLNLLTGLLQLSPASLFHKIKGGYEIPEELGAVGDVISHLGTIVPPFFLSPSTKGPSVQSPRRR